MFIKKEGSFFAKKHSPLKPKAFVGDIRNQFFTKSILNFKFKALLILQKMDKFKL